jgi:signal transduction histidine kinase
MDVRTLAWSLVLVLAALALLGTMVAFQRRDRAVTTWAVGLGGSAVGFLVLLFQQSLPSFMGPLVGNGLVLTFDIALPVGMGFFLGIDRPWKRRFGAYLGVWAVLMTALTFVWPVYPLRAGTTSVTIALFTGEFLWLLIRRRSALPALIRPVVLTIGWAFFLFHLGRAILMPLTSAPTLLADQAFTAVTLLATLVFSVLWAGTLLLVDAGRLQSQVAIHADELVRLNALKDRVLAMTSHDLRGPLGNLQVLWGELTARMTQGRCEEVDRDLLSLVDRSLVGTQSLLENLFSFAESQAAPPDPEAVTELVSAATLVVDQWSVPAQTKGVDLRLVQRAGVLVRAEPEAVLTVLRNLVGNAVKYTRAGGLVTVDLVAAGQGLVGVEVTDTGIGMDADQIHTTFSLESRKSRPGTSGERGSGFGLVLVKELIRSWSGTLDVDSEVGQGTRVRVTFPAVF